MAGRRLVDVAFQTPEAEWRALLTGENPGLVSNHQRMKRLPWPPRCKLCAAPFAGPGGFVHGGGWREAA